MKRVMQSGAARTADGNNIELSNMEGPTTDKQGGGVRGYWVSRCRELAMNAAMARNRGGKKHDGGGAEVHLRCWTTADTTPDTPVPSKGMGICS